MGSIKMGLDGTGLWIRFNWLRMRSKRRVLMNMVMNFCVTYKVGNLFPYLSDYQLPKDITVSLIMKK
jgi:hypothetical protein